MTGSTAATALLMPTETQITRNHRFLPLFCSMAVVTAAAVTVGWVYLAAFAPKRSATLAVCDQFPGFFSSDNGCEKVGNQVSFSSLIANNTEANVWFSAYNDGTVVLSSLQNLCLQFLAKNCGVLQRTYDSYQPFNSDLWQLVVKCDALSPLTIALIVGVAVGTPLLTILAIAALCSCFPRKTEQSNVNAQTLLPPPVGSQSHPALAPINAYVP